MTFSFQLDEIHRVSFALSIDKVSRGIDFQEKDMQDILSTFASFT